MTYRSSVETRNGRSSREAALPLDVDEFDVLDRSRYMLSFPDIHCNLHISDILNCTYIGKDNTGIVSIILLTCFLSFQRGIPVYLLRTEYIGKEVFKN